MTEERTLDSAVHVQTVAIRRSHHSPSSNLMDHHPTWWIWSKLSPKKIRFLNLKFFSSKFDFCLIFSRVARNFHCIPTVQIYFVLNPSCSPGMMKWKLWGKRNDASWVTSSPSDILLFCDTDSVCLTENVIGCHFLDSAELLNSSLCGHPFLFECVLWIMTKAIMPSSPRVFDFFLQRLLQQWRKFSFFSSSCSWWIFLGSSRRSIRRLDCCRCRRWDMAMGAAFPARICTPKCSSSRRRRCPAVSRVVWRRVWTAEWPISQFLWAARPFTRAKSRTLCWASRDGYAGRISRGVDLCRFVVRKVSFSPAY